MIGAKEQNLKKLLKVDYLDNGRNPDIGLDCWGFFRECRRVLSLSVPPENIITEKSLRHEAFLNGKQSPEWEKLPSPKPHCLVLFSHSRHPEHCGMLLDNGYEFFHCTRKYGAWISFIEEYTRLGYKVEFYEYKGN